MDSSGDIDGVENNFIKDLASPSPSEKVRPERSTHRSRTQDVRSTSKSFVDLLVPDLLVHSLTSAGFITPSPVQQVKGADPAAHSLCLTINMRCSPSICADMHPPRTHGLGPWLLYTSDAADESRRVELGCTSVNQKKTTK